MPPSGRPYPRDKYSFSQIERNVVVSYLKPCGSSDVTRQLRDRGQLGSGKHPDTLSLFPETYASLVHRPLNTSIGYQHMPHVRNRYLVDIVKKRLNFFPVVALQGARQVGKSSLVRDLLPECIDGLTYETFDQHSALEFARTSPEAFLEEKTPNQGTLAIDEPQKVPEIFDAVKFIVDRNRIPGKFILLGSTEFSKRTMIRESLTGRMAMLRLYPFTMSECHQLPHLIKDSSLTVHSDARVSRAGFMKHLVSGGMPGAFHIRNAEARDVFYKEWIGLVILRDLTLIPRVKINSDLAQKILEEIAVIAEQTIGALSKALKVDPRRIKTHIECLEALFVLHKLKPHPLGTGQPIYLHCDVGLATYLGASFERRLYTWVYQELLANGQIHSNTHEKLYYYRSLKGNIVHFILEDRQNIIALKIIAKESTNLLDIKGLEAFANKSSSPKTLKLIALGPIQRIFRDRSIEMINWESIV